MNIVLMMIRSNVTLINLKQGSFIILFLNLALNRFKVHNSFLLRPKIILLILFFNWSSLPYNFGSLPSFFIFELSTLIVNLELVFSYADYISCFLMISKLLELGQILNLIASIFLLRSQIEGLLILKRILTILRSLNFIFIFNSILSLGDQ